MRRYLIYGAPVLGVMVIGAFLYGIYKLGVGPDASAAAEDLVATPTDCVHDLFYCPLALRHIAAASTTSATGPVVAVAQQHAAVTSASTSTAVAASSAAPQIYPSTSTVPSTTSAVTPIPPSASAISVAASTSSPPALPALDDQKSQSGVADNMPQQNPPDQDRRGEAKNKKDSGGKDAVTTRLDLSAPTPLKPFKAVRNLGKFLDDANSD